MAQLVRSMTTSDLNTTDLAQGPHCGTFMPFALDGVLSSLIARDA